MARYIDADKLTDKLEELQFNAPVMTPVMKIYNVIELIEDQPTADVVEVADVTEKINFAIKATDTDDDYSAGLRNGLRLALAYIDGKDPQYEKCNNGSDVKHGEWNVYKKDGIWNYDCPFCDEGFVIQIKMTTPPNYCENCGADMRGTPKERDK